MHEAALAHGLRAGDVFDEDGGPGDSEQGQHGEGVEEVGEPGRDAQQAEAGVERDQSEGIDPASDRNDRGT